MQPFMADVHHHHHRRRFNVRFSMLARVGRFPQHESLHRVRSCAHSTSRPRAFMSLFTHSIHVLRTRPLLDTPATFKLLQADTQSSSCFLSTCPNHLSLPRLTTSATATKPNRSFNFTLAILSFKVTLHIHLTIILSVLSNLCISSTFIGHVSLPYTSTLCTQALYNLPFTLREAPLDVRIGDNSLNLAHAHLTLALDASSAPPPDPIISPK